MLRLIGGKLEMFVEIEVFVVVVVCVVAVQLIIYGLIIWLIVGESRKKKASISKLKKRLAELEERQGKLESDMATSQHQHHLDTTMETELHQEVSQQDSENDQEHTVGYATVRTASRLPSDPATESDPSNSGNTLTNTVVEEDAFGYVVLNGADKSTVNKVSTAPNVAYKRSESRRDIQPQQLPVV